MSENCIQINFLDGKSFLVPIYQRGYKWRGKDVRYLVEDLIEQSGSEKPYYLQPLVVVQKNNKYIVVDGQQRLTTFFLIINYLMLKCGKSGLPKFTIEYENRPSGNAYLSNISDIPNISSPTTPDIRRYNEAWDELMRLHNKLSSDSFVNAFTEKMTMLWYELNDPNKGPATFDKLNGKRVPVSDVELCKAYLLNTAPKLRRAERAAAWEEMEYKLHDDDFFSFVADTPQLFNTSSRMQLLLNLIVDHDDSDQWTEHPLYDKLRHMNEDAFVGLIKAFRTLESWYQSNVIYNFIGFLIVSGKKKLSDIYHYTEFETDLLADVQEAAKIDVGSLEYKSSNTYPTLLLYNVLCSLIRLPDSNANDKLDERFHFQHKFPFEHFSKDNKNPFDKEHVHATNSKTMNDSLQWQKWMVGILNHCPEEIDDKGKSPLMSKEDKLLMQSIVDMKSDDSECLRKMILKRINQETFNDLFERITNMLEESSDDNDDQNSIGNLALLSRDINRDPAYAASPFSVKRAIIRERIKEGVYVPEGTLKMFNKGFEDMPQEMWHWRKVKYPDGSKSDNEQFIDEIVSTFEKIL